MKFWNMVVMAVMVVSLVACSTGEQQAETETMTEVKLHGEPITITEVTSIDDMMMNPDEYLNKEVVISGQVNGRCMGSGCWIRMDRGEEKEGLIVRTLDESFIFPEECMDHTVTVQGKLMLQNAEEIEASKEHAEEADHFCPNPEYYFFPMGIRIDA